MEKDAATRPLTPEEEALKRSTDCVYFLASPLTCKKGTECDYRHSEGARVNPRDCYYWLSGNCLNPKCSFRHPPLDGLFGIPGATAVPALPSKQVSTHQVPGMHAPASSNLNKPAVPCFFFQKGQCLKGDKCAFMHGPQSTAPQPTVAPVPQQVGKASASVTQPLQSFKKDTWNLKECASHQNTPNSIVARQFEVPPMSAKSVQRTEIVAINGSTLHRNLSPYPLDVELSRSQPSNLPVGNGVVSRSQSSNVPVVNDVTSMSRSNHSQPADERFQNGRNNVDEFLGESSPGFDVLVENDIEDTDYLHNDDEFGREPVQGGRNSYPANDFEYHQSGYEPPIKHERDQLNGKDTYDNHERKHGRFDREQRRSSSERIGDRRLIPDWRVRRREESPDVIDGLDLRHRLLKQRRLNGSRSAVSPDRHAEPRRRDDRYVEGERYRGRHPHKDDRHFPLESSISSRLQGRIKLPVRSSPDRPVGLRLDRDRPVGLRLDRERDRDRGIHRGRLSPTRPTNYLERNHDRMKRRLDEDLAIDNRNFRSQREDSDSLNFVGPKSLAELKSKSSQEQVNKKTSFQDTGAISSDEKENSYSEEEEGALGSLASESTSNLRLIPSSSTANDNRSVQKPEELNVTAADEEEEEGLIPEADEADHLPAKHATEVEEGTIVKDAEDEEEGLIPEAAEVGYSPAKDTMEVEEDVVEFAEDRDAEYPEPQNEEWDYEEGLDEGDVKAEDNETLYDEDYLDDEDDADDFAKKVGMMFS